MITFRAKILKGMDEEIDQQELAKTHQEIGFEPDSMVTCRQCQRANPPNRLKCLYCGAELELTEAQLAGIAVTQRRPESHQTGFNVVLLGSESDPQGIIEAARVLNIERATAEALVAASVPLPCARVDSMVAAEAIRSKLAAFNMESTIIGDDELNGTTPPRRLRSIDFAGDGLTLIAFNNDEVETVQLASLRVIVSGVLVEKAVESTEKRKKGQTLVVDQFETASDDVVLDIYFGSDRRGWRIQTNGFDFSCLGADKSLRAHENIARLEMRLAACGPDVRVIREYREVRQLLGVIWEVEERRDSKGLARQRFGKFDLSSVVTSSNRLQFNKFSRLQAVLADVL